MLSDIISILAVTYLVGVWASSSAIKHRVPDLPRTTRMKISFGWPYYIRYVAALF